MAGSLKWDVVDSGTTPTVRLSGPEKPPRRSQTRRSPPPPHGGRGLFQSPVHLQVFEEGALPRGHSNNRGRCPCARLRTRTWVGPAPSPDASRRRSIMVGCESISPSDPVRRSSREPAPFRRWCARRWCRSGHGSRTPVSPYCSSSSWSPLRPPASGGQESSPPCRARHAGPSSSLSRTSRSSSPSGADIQTAALLTLVGFAAALILCGRRKRHTHANEQQAQLSGILRTAGIVAAGSSHTEGVIEHVADQLVELLGIDDCYFDSDIRNEAPAALVRDGTVVRRGRDLDVERFGLPTDCEIELRVHHNGVTRGRFLLVASTRLALPSLAQRQVAVALADQVGAALATHDRSS